METNSKRKIIPSGSRVTEVFDVIKVECLSRYFGVNLAPNKFNLYYLLVCCSDYGIVRNRLHSGRLIRDKLGMKSQTYRYEMMQLKKEGLISVEDGMIRVNGFEGLDWGNKPVELVVKKDIAKDK